MKERSTFINCIWMIVKRDISAYYRGIVWIFMVFLYFLTWVFFTATTLGNLVTVRNYFQFLIAGMIVIGIYNSSFTFMTVISGEKRRGYIKYLLSLPINRVGLSVGRLLTGMLQGVTFSFFMLVITFLLLGFPGIIVFIALTATIFCLAFGLSGLGIAAAVFLKPELADPASDVLGLWLVFTSTIFYPDNIIPQMLRPVSMINPLSAASNLLRVGLGLRAFSWLDVTVLVVFTSFFAMLSIVAYRHKIETLE